MTTTSSSEEKPSSCASSSLRVCRLDASAPPPPEADVPCSETGQLLILDKEIVPTLTLLSSSPPDRFDPSESSSSMKMMAGARSLATVNICRIRIAPTPTYLKGIRGEGQLKFKGSPELVATHVSSNSEPDA